MLTSEEVIRAIDDLILSGQVDTGRQAEARFLGEHLNDVIELVETLDDSAFREHEFVRLLLSHGRRPWEDEIL